MTTVEVTEREALQAMIDQCAHALNNLAKSGNLRYRLKTLERRCKALMKREDGREWGLDFARVFATAEAVFDDLLEEIGEVAPEPEKQTAH